VWLHGAHFVHDAALHKGKRALHRASNVEWDGSLMTQSFYTGKVVLIDYTNWRGVRTQRRIIPQTVRFGSNKWHKEEQWLLQGVEALTGEQREYALKDIHEWQVAVNQSLGWR
jgi:hypothetical protein